MDDDRNALQPRGPYNRRGDESPLAKDDVGLDAGQEEQGFEKSEFDAKDIRKILPVDIAAEFARGHGAIGYALAGDEFLLDPVSRADVVYVVAGIAQTGQQRDIGGDMPGGASADEDDGGQECLLCTI